MTRNRRLDPEWRQFEQLVARIERDADRLGLVINAPDRVRCKITNRLREVDASIRTGSGELITLECRKRGGKEDVTWIEQLATKRQSLGAIRTIAVSARGFSDTAQQLAACNQIELKKVSELQPSELNPLLGLDLVVFWHRRVELKSIGLQEARADRDLCALPDPADVDAILPNDVDIFAPLFCNTDEGHRWSVNQIWHQLQDAANPYALLPKMARPIVRIAWFPYSGNVTVDLPHGTMRLGGVILTVALWWESEPVWQSSATKVSYRARDDDGHQRIEFSSALSTDEWAVSLQAPAKATEVRDLRNGGTWPHESNSSKHGPWSAPIDLV